jgi:hypothetical protein
VTRDSTVLMMHEILIKALKNKWAHIVPSGCRRFQLQVVAGVCQLVQLDVGVGGYKWVQVVSNGSG